MIAIMALMAMATERSPATEPSRDTVMRFATCVRRRAPDRADALLATNPDSDEEKKKIGVIAGAYGACVGDRNGLSFSAALLRGQLAELAFRDSATLREKAAALPRMTPIRPDVALIEKSANKAPPSWRDQRYAQQFRIFFARCVTDADPQGVAALISTTPGTTDERSALIKTGDMLMRCMPEGVTYHIKAAELRPYLMSALYFRAVSGMRPGG